MAMTEEQKLFIAQDRMVLFNQITELLLHIFCILMPPRSADELNMLKQKYTEFSQPLRDRLYQEMHALEPKVAGIGSGIIDARFLKNPTDPTVH